MSSSKINLTSFFQGIATLIDSTHPQFRSQHLKTALIALRLAKLFQVDSSHLGALTLASLIRDIGTLTLQERLNIQSGSPQHIQQHGAVSGWILGQTPDLVNVADIIRNHHVAYSQFSAESIPNHVAFLSQILHLADRVACMVNPDQLALLCAQKSLEWVRLNSGSLLHPDICSAFEKLACNETFWLDLDTVNVERAFSEIAPTLSTTLKGFEKVALVFRYFIDFRSEFTIAHTAGVAAVAEKLAEKMNFSTSDLQKIRIAAYLHDIGKYVVPAEILEKPIALSSEEFGVIRATPYYTYWCLATTGQSDIQEWAGHHHERLNGSGYPFGLTATTPISLGAQIIGFSDMFSAMIEQRPYRDGKSTSEALSILQMDAENGKIDRTLVELAKTHESELSSYHAQKSEEAFDIYNGYIKSLMYTSIR